MRYYVFAYADYYASGGMKDAVYKSDDLNEIKEWLLDETLDEYDDGNFDHEGTDNLQIYDTKTDEFILELMVNEVFDDEYKEEINKL